MLAYGDIHSCRLMIRHVSDRISAPSFGIEEHPIGACEAEWEIEAPLVGKHRLHSNRYTVFTSYGEILRRILSSFRSSSEREKHDGFRAFRSGDRFEHFTVQGPQKLNAILPRCTSILDQPGSDGSVIFRSEDEQCIKSDREWLQALIVHVRPADESYIVESECPAEVVEDIIKDGGIKMGLVVRQDDEPLSGQMRGLQGILQVLQGVSVEGCPSDHMSEEGV